MNVSAVSPTPGNSYPSGSERDVKQLEDQIKELQQKIKDENRSFDDVKTKKRVVEQLQAQIELKKAQVQQALAKKSKQDNAVEQTASSENCSANNKIDIRI